MAVADDRKQLPELVDGVIADPVGCQSVGCGWHPWVGLRVCRLYSAASYVKFARLTFRHSYIICIYTHQNDIQSTE